MTSDSLDNKLPHQHSLSTIFQWMPSCALVIDLNGVIHEVNQQAIEFFRATTKEDFIFDKQNIKNIIIDSQRAVDLIKLISKTKESIYREILLRRFDKTIASVNLIACIFPDNPTYIIFQFIESHPYNQVILTELSHAFHHEAQRLKPYLNKPGKNLLEEVIVSDLLEDIVANKPTRNDQINVVGDERINLLTKYFPEFSTNELILCGYLSLKLSIDDISSLTGKTSNSLRVSLHRILQKTNFSSSKEFLRKLSSLK
ncbi:MAG: hypothetical protein P4L34_12955 [Paludibacter sp.]|nr:hypothetical protein [Paludibacter sp.]